MKLQFAALCILATLAQAVDQITYDGLRLDLSALTLNRDIIGTIVPALNRTLSATFPEFSESGSFWTALHLRGIQIGSYRINEERFDINAYEYVAPVYRLKGSFEAIYFNIAFDYELTLLGIRIDSGRGTAAITNIRSEILVFFNDTDPDVQIPHPWEVKNMTMSSTLASESWAQSMLQSQFVPVFHTTVDMAMDDFAHNLLRTYRHVEDIFPGDIDLVFHNELMHVQPSAGNMYMSIAFKMDVEVNKHIHKRMFRKINGTIRPQGDFDYCLPAELIPTVLDALSKGGYYDAEVPAVLWGFATDQMKELFQIIPSLKQKYTETEQFVINCAGGRLETVNDITQRDLPQPLLQLQKPEDCYIYAPSTGESFLVMKLFLRFYYEMQCDNESYYGRVMGAQLYSYHSVPELPVTRALALERHLKIYADLFSNTKLASPGIKILPNRHYEVRFDWAYPDREEICFYYREMRPVANVSKPN